MTSHRQLSPRMCSGLSCHQRQPTGASFVLRTLTPPPAAPGALPSSSVALASGCFWMLPDASRCFRMLPDASRCFQGLQLPGAPSPTLETTRTPLFLSHLTSAPSASPVGSIFRISLLLSAPSASTLAEPPPSLAWITAVASPLPCLPVSLPMASPAASSEGI